MRGDAKNSVSPILLTAKQSVLHVDPPLQKHFCVGVNPSLQNLYTGLHLRACYRYNHLRGGGQPAGSEFTYNACMCQPI
jgi:hypothetical protein